MSDPAIKGVLFAAVVDDLSAAVEDGLLSRTAIEAALEVSDLALLDEKINAISWYDIFAYHRILDLLCQTTNKDSHTFYFDRGVHAAKRLRDSGLYQQLDYLGRIEASHLDDPQAKFEAFGRDMRLILTLHVSMLNFGDWSVVPDPDAERCYRVVAKNVAQIPDGVFIAACGLFNGLASDSSGGQWEYERSDRDVVVIKMTDPL